MANLSEKKHSWAKVSSVSEEDKLKFFNKDHGFGKSKDLAILLLKTTINILNDFKINYCLISGTLLGQVRHNDFIPWDDDIDILVDDTIMGKLPAIIDKHQNDLVLFKVDNDYRQLKSCLYQGKLINDPFGWGNFRLNHTGGYLWPFVDLWIYKINSYQIDQKLKNLHIKGVSKNILKKRFSSLEFFDQEWNIEKFFPFKTVRFLDLDVKVPNDSDHFLSINYGSNYMTEFKSNWFSHKEEKTIEDVKIIDSKRIL